MEKELSDYLHFYLGCQCLIGDSKDIDYIRMVNETGLSVCTGTNIKGVPIWYKTNSCKPLLRPLSDISVDEWIEAGKIHLNCGGRITITIDEMREPTSLVQHPEVFRYLLSKGFDLFQLIESGLALDKTKL